jgi:hypothetical protein
MLIKTEPGAPTSFADLIAALDVHDSNTSFGSDIDIAHRQMFESPHTAQENLSVFLQWAARWQPCLFGRLGSKGLKDVGIDVCWLTEDDINAGDTYVSEKIQKARRAWKERSAAGIAHGFLIMFNHPRLARAQPGIKLLEVCRRVSDLYLVEHAPIECDVIYTEAIPLQTPEGLTLFKGGINVFYPSAHRTVNHDRRIPGGVMISVNSPGHYANSLIKNGSCSSLDEAIERVMNLALNSIGNGGIGHETMPSCSWRNPVTKELEGGGVCPHVTESGKSASDKYSTRTYSAFYHTDVLVPTDVTVDATLDPNLEMAEKWSHLIIDYMSSRQYSSDHVNFGLFHGAPIPDEARYHNPWPPRKAINAPLANY